MWVGKVGESGVQQMSPHTNTQNYTGTHRHVHMRVHKYLFHSLTHRHACPHTNTGRCTHIHAPLNIQENMHIYSRSESVSLSLSHTVSHPHSVTLQGPSGLCSVSSYNAMPSCGMFFFLLFFQFWP